MDTEKCRVLLTVLHERSLSAAAEALGYTPSGISRLVDSLERETGFPLLHRGRGGVSATRACQELLPLMRRMAELDEQYQQLAHRIQGLDVGRVVAGTNYAAFYPWLSEVIAGFHHAYPGIRVELREGSSTQLGELVDHRRADFCLISQRPGRHEWVPLKDDQLMAILPPTTRWWRRTASPWSGCGRSPSSSFCRGRRQITPGCSSSCRSGPRSASPPATAGPPLPWCGRGWASPY